MSKAITKERMAPLNEASDMFGETGCVPGIDGEQVRAERIVPDAKEYIRRLSMIRKRSMTRRYGMHLGLRLSFRGWHKSGIEDATSSHLVAVRTRSNI
jgi:hypothetical protein